MRGSTMVFTIALSLVAASLGGMAEAQTATGNAVPAEIGNRANGKDYQPTPNGVAPREQAAGVLPDVAHEQAQNRAVERIDKDALHSVGASTQSVPHMATGQQ